MKARIIELELEKRKDELQRRLHMPGARLGLLTSIDGSQLLSLVLDTEKGSSDLLISKLAGRSYHSLTPTIAQCHWFERSTWDMFGLYPEGHPRLKHNLLHEPYDPEFLPLAHASPAVDAAPPGASADNVGFNLSSSGHRIYHNLEVEGEGVYEVPVGPIHAGIIEPGHFRFSCVGEIIMNLEIRLGYVHRGLEKRLSELPLKKLRFAAEAAASDTVSANALAHAEAIESMLELELSPKARFLRSLSLEIERVAMHISDLGGLAADIGFLAISSSMARLRGNALRLAELLSGSRFQRAFICPGGVAFKVNSRYLAELKSLALKLRQELDPLLEMFLKNQIVCERMKGVGRVSKKLAKDFGLVGVAARASGQNYDCRFHFMNGCYFDLQKLGVMPALALEHDGDVYSRAKVRAFELGESLKLIELLSESLPEGAEFKEVPESLPENAIGVSVVEAHRGELIHLILSDSKGRISRYHIKDPSVNNWTALAIAVRNNLLADFPLCNKSFSLSYSGHDL